VKEKRNYYKNPDNPRWKITENSDQVTIQTQRLNEEKSAQSTLQNENQNYNGDVSDTERLNDTQLIKKKRKYNKNPNHPRWKKKIKSKFKISSEHTRNEDSDRSYDPRKNTKKTKQKKKIKYD